MRAPSRLFVVMLAVGASLTGCGDEGGDDAPPTDGGQPTGEEPAREVTLMAEDFAFIPDQINALAGERITFVLTNHGGQPHSIAFDFPDGDVRMDGELAPGETGSVTITVPEVNDVFTFFCPVLNHHDLGMEGQLLVAGASDDGTTTDTGGDTGTDTGTDGGNGGPIY